MNAGVGSPGAAPPAGAGGGGGSGGASSGSQEEGHLTGTGSARGSQAGGRSGPVSRNQTMVQVRAGRGVEKGGGGGLGSDVGGSAHPAPDSSSVHTRCAACPAPLPPPVLPHARTGAFHPHHSCAPPHARDRSCVGISNRRRFAGLGLVCPLPFYSNICGEAVSPCITIFPFQIILMCLHACMPPLPSHLTPPRPPLPSHTPPQHHPPPPRTSSAVRLCAHAKETPRRR